MASKKKKSQAKAAAKPGKNGGASTSSTPADGPSITVEKRADGVGVIRLSLPGEAVNTLRGDFADDFDRVFSEVARDTDITAVVFTSGKPDSFIVGADVRMLEAAKTARDARALSKRGQDALDRIARFDKPVVAAIHGACLGGGLEVALACRARVASDDTKTKLGLPEVQLGLLPGAGGTQRLPRLIGVQAALDLMLTGRQIDARRARKLGLVDEVVPAAILVDVAAERALALVGATRAKERPIDRLKHLLHKDELQEIALADNPLGRKVLFDQARKQLRRKSRGNYPAPERILAVVKTGLADGIGAGLEAENEAFGELVVSDEAAALMSIFFATQALKKDNGVADPSVRGRRVDKVGMLGAGLMGAGIAYVSASIAGIPVRLKDRDDKGVLAGLSHVRSGLDERVKRKRLSRMEADRTMSLVTGTTTYSGFADCDVVIEAVFEDLALKHAVLADVEANASPECIFASNTSSIPIGRIADEAKRPENVVGMHYFSPVEKMPLLEIIATDRTSPEVVATCVALGKRQGKTVIVVNDGVGFYTTRILAPFMNEAAHILSEGVAVEKIDDALMDYGYPVGPIKLTDEVGIDVGEKVGGIMLAAFGDRLEPPAGIERLVADGRKGRKNEKGFYRYGADVKKREVDESVYAVLGVEPTKEMDPLEIAERCCLQMVNEAMLSYGEGILRSARDGDIGAIFGLGFPPFRGGPFRYVDALGADQVMHKLQRYRDFHGKRFEPAPILVEMAKTGARFYGQGSTEAPPPGTFKRTGPASGTATKEARPTAR